MEQNKHHDKLDRYIMNLVIKYIKQIMGKCNQKMIYSAYCSRQLSMSYACDVSDYR